MVTEEKIYKVDPEELDVEELLTQGATTKAKERVAAYVVGALGVLWFLGLVADEAGD